VVILVEEGWLVLVLEDREVRLRAITRLAEEDETARRVAETLADAGYKTVEEAFDEHRRRQATVRFESGWQLSVVYGRLLYCSLRRGFLSDEPTVPWDEPTPTAEIAAISVEDTWATWDCDDTVRGWCSAEFVARVAGILGSPEWRFSPRDEVCFHGDPPAVHVRGEAS
jgi:hypothetical protein